MPTDRLQAAFPIATDQGRPITAVNRDEFIAEGLGGPGDAFIREVSDRVFIGTLSYPAADLRPESATLTMRVREADPRAMPPGLSWRYLISDTSRLPVRRA